VLETDSSWADEVNLRAAAEARALTAEAAVAAATAELAFVLTAGAQELEAVAAAQRETRVQLCAARVEADEVRRDHGSHRLSEI
jgi:hypothetical protein